MPAESAEEFARRGGKKRARKKPTLTGAALVKLLRKGAIGAAELDQRLRRQFVSPVPAFRGKR